MSMTSSERKHGLKRRRVVSSFICKSKPDFQVLIFKRSDQVRSYKEKWAACSGSLESTDSDPLSAAWREIEEETTLTKSDLTFLRAGKSYSIVDANLNTEWTIYPFAFLTKSENAQITIDWEHTDYKWIQASDLKTFDTVPHLSASLEKVLVTPRLAEGLLDLQNDNVNGARVLATKALITMKEAVEEQFQSSSVKDDSETAWKEIRMIGWHLAKNGRPSMGSGITNAVLDALDRVHNTGSGTLPDANTLRSRVKNVIDERCQERGQLLVQLAAHFIETTRNLGKAPERLEIVTLSSSSTVKAALTQLLSQNLDRKAQISILESRPLCEGLKLAQHLVGSFQHLMSGDDPDLKITIAPDSAAALLSKDADLLVLGADRISSAGDVSNKTGSLPAVTTAKAVSPDIKVVIVSEAEKIAPPEQMEQHVEEDNGPDEVTTGWPLDTKELNLLVNSNALHIRNVFFEWVPARYIDTYVCETGILSAKEIGSRSSRVRDLEDQLWGDI